MKPRPRARGRATEPQCGGAGLEKETNDDRQRNSYLHRVRRAQKREQVLQGGERFRRLQA